MAIDEADNEQEWDDAAWFARRGMRAANGEVVLPANPETLTSWHWSVPLGGRLEALMKARAQLIAALDGGARDRVPADAAHVQGLYDCWAEEEAERDDATACAGDFRARIGGLTMVKVAAPAPAPVVSGPVAKGGFQVFFDWDKFNITPEAAKTIRLAADGIRQGHVVRIDVTGHTDSSGTPSYNQPLSERRAAAVRAELVRDGVPVTEIQAFGVGESGQLVPTPDNVREPQNRRAEIVLQR